MHKQYGLTAQFVRWILVSALASAALFAILHFGGQALLSQYFDSSDFQERHTELHLKEFQEYVTANDLSITDTSEITKWAQKAPLILMEIYDDNILVYSSAYPDDSNIWDNEIEAPYYEWESYRPVTFDDADAEVVLYCDDTYLFYNYATIMEIILAFLLFLSICLKGTGSLIAYIRQLSSEIQVLEGGDLNYPVTVKDNNELTTLAKSLDSMRLAFQQQREQEAKSFAMNQSLIVDMSHDLRTPLTTLLIYTEILHYKKYENEAQLNDYLEKVDAKAHQIKRLSDNIFEYSLLSRDKVEKPDPPKLFHSAFEPLLSESIACLTRAGFQVVQDLNWEEAYISVYQQYIERILGNVVSNIQKYADPAAPIDVETINSSSSVGLSFTNTVRPNADDNNGTHIGLSSVESMMKKMNATVSVERSDGGFCMTLIFPKC